MKRWILSYIHPIYMCVLYICLYLLLLLPLPPLKSMTYKWGAVTALPKLATSIRKPPVGGSFDLMASLPGIGINQRELLAVGIAHDVRSHVEHGILLILFCRSLQRFS